MRKKKTPQKTQPVGSVIPPWWWSQCLDNINKIPGGTICAQEACDNTIIRNFAHAYCTCQPPYPNGCVPITNPPPNCCEFGPATPLPVFSENCYCYCCCGCFANSTPVAFDKDQYKELVEFEVGDLIYVADDINLTSWSQRRVVWSAGAGDLAAPSLMIKVTFGSLDKPDYLLVSRAQLFLIPGGKLKPAAALVPGSDSLVATDGTPYPVLSLEVGMFKKGLHHIATSMKAATSPGGHLIVAKNIVAGDWALQIGLSTQARSGLALAEGVEDMPEFGSKEYEQSLANQKLEVSPFRVAVPGLPGQEASAAEFSPFALGNKMDLPEEVYAFLTPKQAADVAAKATISPPSTQAGKESVQHLFKLFGAFYPTVTFSYDEQNTTPNAYFYGETDSSHLVVTGGLARCEALKYEGMAVVIATMIGAIASGPPYNDQDFSCLSLASYTAIGSTIPRVWLGLQSVPIIKGGVSQITELFGLVLPGNHGGGNTCMDASLDCRLQAMNDAFNLKPLPICAGGLSPAALAVTGAEGSVGLPHGTVTVSFNMSVDPMTASEPANYVLYPTARILSAKVSPDDPTKVLVGASLDSETYYELDVTGVLSDQQQPLIFGENTALFTTK